MRLELIVGMGLIAAGWGAAAEPPDLPPLARYHIDPRAITVSGISAGGYMAGQLLVAHSATIRGAGIIAAGPYYCAQNSLTFGLYRCMETSLGTPPVPQLIKDTHAFAAAGGIDAVDGVRQALRGTNSTNAIFYSGLSARQDLNQVRFQLRDAAKLQDALTALKPVTVVLLADGSPTMVVVATSAAGVDARKVWASIQQACGGKGGGTPSLVQGASPAGADHVDTEARRIMQQHSA